MPQPIDNGNSSFIVVFLIKIVILQVILVVHLTNGIIASWSKNTNQNKKVKQQDRFILKVWIVKFIQTGKMISLQETNFLFFFRTNIWFLFTVRTTY